MLALPVERPERSTLARAIHIAGRIVLFVVSIAIFILALVMVKEGAKPLAPLIRERFSVDSPASALGFGWLAASMVLSGSPIAATSLAFLDARVLTPIESFAMIAGSPPFPRGGEGQFAVLPRHGQIVTQVLDPLVRHRRLPSSYPVSVDGAAVTPEYEGDARRGAYMEVLRIPVRRR